jgi:C1A family cysteine protease
MATTIPTRSVAGYGWIPDLPDVRDLQFAAAPEVVKELPPKVDLRDQCPPVYDQGQLGSCTANAIAAALEFDQMKQHEKEVFVPSRLFIYYCEREVENSVDSDSGAQLRDGIKCVNDIGAPPETDWPYEVSKFRDKPSETAYADAKMAQALEYKRIQRALDQMKACLAEGYPFVFGFAVYESLEGDEVKKTGVAQMPAQGETLMGGHAVLAVGYDDAEERLIVRNSWSDGWGMKGYFTLPYGYLTERGLASDFWAIRSVS